MCDEISAVTTLESLRDTIANGHATHTLEIQSVAEEVRSSRTAHSQEFQVLQQQINENAQSLKKTLKEEMASTLKEAMGDLILDMMKKLGDKFPGGNSVVQDVHNTVVENVEFDNTVEDPIEDPTLTITLKSAQSDDKVEFEFERTVSAEEDVKFSQMCQFLDLIIAVLGMILNKSKVQFNVVPRVIVVDDSEKSLSIASLITGILFDSAADKSLPVFAMLRRENVYYSVFGKWNSIYRSWLIAILHPPGVEVSPDIQECARLVCDKYLDVAENCQPIFHPAGFHDMWNQREALELLPTKDHHPYLLFDGKNSTDGFKLVSGFGAFLILVQNMLDKNGSCSDDSLTSLKTQIGGYLKRMFERSVINPLRSTVSNSLKDFVKFSADRIVGLESMVASSNTLDVEERCGDLFAIYCGSSPQCCKRVSDVEYAGASMPPQKKRKKKATQGNQGKSNNGGM